MKFAFSIAIIFQRQDTDERLRRLQTDKESLAMRVQELSEQVSAQSEKIHDLERLITDKSQLITNTEEILQRVKNRKKNNNTSKFVQWNVCHVLLIALFFSHFGSFRIGNVVTFVVGNAKTGINVGNERIEITSSGFGT